MTKVADDPVASLGGIAGYGDALRGGQTTATAAVHAYQERIAAYGQHVADCYLDDAAQIIGTRPHDVVEADQKLEAYVNQAGPEEDECLFTVLCTDILRRCLMLAIEGSTYYKGLTEPVQPLE